MFSPVHLRAWNMDRQECLSYLTMKFSYNWLREYVEGLDTPPIKLEALITMKTAECEGVEKVGLFLSDGRVGPVTGEHHRFGREAGKEAILDRADDRGEVATRELGRTRPAREQRVTAEEHG